MPDKPLDDDQELDELARSLQQQIQDFDHIPELDDILEDSNDDQNDSAWYEQQIDTLEEELADNQPAVSLHNMSETSWTEETALEDDTRIDPTSETETDLSSQLDRELQQQPSAAVRETSGWFRLQWVVLGISALFIVFGASTFYLLQSDSDGSSTQTTTDLTLPDSDQTLIQNEDMPAVDITHNDLNNDTASEKLPPQKNKDNTQTIPEAPPVSTAKPVETAMIDSTVAQANKAVDSTGKQTARPTITARQTTDKARKRIRLVYADNKARDIIHDSQSSINVSENITAPVTASATTPSAPVIQHLLRDKDKQALVPDSSQTAKATKQSDQTKEMVKNKNLIQPQHKQPVNIQFEFEKKQPVENLSSRIDYIQPAPVIGKNTRQWLDIYGKGFSKDSRLQLQWINTRGKTVSKVFSTQKTPQQIQFIDSKHIRLHVNVGTREAVWKIKLLNNSKQAIYYQFKIVPPYQADQPPRIANLQNQAVASPSAPNNTPNQTPPKSNQHFFERDASSFIARQPDQHYTIQLYSSKDFARITQLLQRYQKLDALYWYQQKKGQPNPVWYSLIYGSFATLNQAKNAARKLPYALRGKKPWYRRFGAIKGIVGKRDHSGRRINHSKTSLRKTIKSIPKTGNPKHQPAPSTTVQKMRQEILHTYPGKWTLQLISLNNEHAMREYIKRNKLGNKARYFTRTIQGQQRYTLIYGTFQTRALARQAMSKLPSIIRRGKPWIRQYGEIFRLMQ